MNKIASELMQTIKIFSLLLLVVFNNCITQQSTAQISGERLQNIESAFPAMDKIAREFADKNHLPGFIYGVVADGKLVHITATGYTDAVKKIPINAQSVFRIASMTKSFTAMAIVKLRDEGKLKLNDPVYKYIPEMKGQRYLTTDAAPITIHDLLTHAAGFPEDNPWGDRQLAVTDEEMIGMIKKGISFSSVPGTAYEYSNMGFALLGYIIKKVSGQPYQKYITGNILKPLGMVNTYWDFNDVPANQLAHGYRWLNGKWTEQPLLKDGAYGAMGGMMTTIEDFGKYVALHLAAWPPGNGKERVPVKRSSIREMQHCWNINRLNSTYRYPGGRLCPMVTGYGYGLRWAEDCDNRIIIGHSGGLPGFGSNWSILPDYGIGIISFGNLTYAPASFLNMQLLDTLITIAKIQRANPTVSAILNQRKNELIRLLPHWNNAPGTGIFAMNFFMDYFTDSLTKEATAIFNKAGRILHIGELTPTNNLRGSFIMEGEKANIKISFTLTPENPPLIQEYHISELRK